MFSLQKCVCVNKNRQFDLLVSLVFGPLLTFCKEFVAKLIFNIGKCKQFAKKVLINLYKIRILFDLCQKRNK